MARQTLHGFIMREAAVCGRMKPKAPTEREVVFDILRQIEGHSPTWTKKIRAYIIKVEQRAAQKRGKG